MLQTSEDLIGRRTIDGAEQYEIGFAPLKGFVPKQRHWLPPVFVESALPLFNRLQDRVPFDASPPDGFVILKPDLILSFAKAIVFTAKMRQVRDPQDAVERDVLVIDFAEYGSHGNALPGPTWFTSLNF